MPTKITRLELVIIVAALTVLLFSNRPPQPGNAEPHEDIGLTAEAAQNPLPPSQPAFSQSEETAPVVAVQTDGFDAQPSTPPATDNVSPVSVPQTQKTKRIGMVDARQCDSLRYPNIMYGEIVVRWVWDGTRFVPRKVCEVKESNGVVSVWSFDDHHDGVVIEEVPEDQVPAY